MKKTILTIFATALIALVVVFALRSRVEAQVRVPANGAKGTVEEQQLGTIHLMARDAAAAIRPGPDAGHQRRAITMELANELEAFITNHPNSTLNADVHLWLGRNSQQSMSYASAMEHYASAWAELRDSTVPADKIRQIEASGSLAKLLVLTGRLPELQELERQVRQLGDKRAFGGGWGRALEMRSWVQKHPNEAYKCGLHCLDQLGRMTQMGEFRPKDIVETDSTTNGFSAAELIAIGAKAGLKIHAAQLSDFTQLPVPSIVHLRSEHFVVIKEQRGAFYNVVDTAAVGAKWVTAAEIAKEATGCVIVSDVQKMQTTPIQMRSMDIVEADGFRGRCHGPLPSDHDDSPCEDECSCPLGSNGSSGSSGGSGSGSHGTHRTVSSIAPASTGGSSSSGGGGKGGGCGSCSGPVIMGMPTWFVSEPYLNLWLKDTPLVYHSAVGPKVQLQLTYATRHVASDLTGLLWRGAMIGGISSGSVWNCNWMSFAELSSDEYIVELKLPSGGWATYAFPLGSTKSGVNYRNQTVLEKLGTVGAITNLVLHFPDGSQTSYQAKDSSDISYAGVFYMTQQTDASGKSTYFNYSLNLFLQSVTAADGTVFTLHYDDAIFSSFVSSVTSSYGATVAFTYDPGHYADGNLSSITDAAGITSQFVNSYEYGDGLQLVTPYGTTTFNTFTSFNLTYNFDRLVRITLPDGTQEFYGQKNTYGGSSWPDFDSSLIPTNTPTATLDTTERQERNTFYWNAQQFAPFVTTDVDTFDWDVFKKSRIRHWLATTLPTYTHWDSLSMEQAPSPDGTTEGQMTWYDYAGKPIGLPYEAGTQIQPSVIAMVMPDGSTRYNYFERLINGLPTVQVEKWNVGSTAYYRTNLYSYAANGVDMIQHIGADGTRAVSNYFNAYHQVLASYDVLNQETKYTYDATTKLLTSVTRPSGLVTTNIYFAGTTRLDKTIDLQINRTNAYTWGADGNVYSHTDERGLTVTNYWDGLNRQTGRKYPDGTTTTNLFSIAAAYPASSGGLNILETTAMKDRMGFWTYFGYDSMRRRTAVTNANGVITRYGYCDCGAVSYVTNAWNTPAEMSTSYVYDFQGHAIYTYLPDTTITNWFDALGRNVSSCDGWGCRWYGYDNLSRRTSVTNGLGAVEQTMVYDIEDRPIYVTDANNVTVTNTYDDLGRLRTRGYPDGGVEKFGYSARGLTAYTNQLNFKTYYVYDEASRKRFETNANFELIRYTNNAAGDLLALVDGKNQVTKWNYDEFGRVTNKVDQTGSAILTYKYDPNSRLTNRWSTAKGDTKYKYDAVGSLTNVDYAVSPDVTLQYDPMNRVTNMVDAAGTTKYTYTTAGRLLTEDGPWSSDTVTNYYNNGLRTNLVLAQPTGKWTNGFGYDAAKRLTNVTSPAGSFTYSYYQQSTLIQKLTLPNTSYITNAYDSVARMRFTKLNNSGNTTLDAAAYGYNSGNQRVTATNTPGSRYNYTNDAIGQLIVADSSLNSEDRGYTYDAAWNLNYRTNNGTLQTFKVDGKNQLTNAIGSTYTYDGNGNKTNHAGITYAYDDENRLTLVSDEVNHTYRYGYVYDGRGRLKYRQNYYWQFLGPSGYMWIPTDSVRYIYDGMRVIQERIVDSPMVSYTLGTDLSGSLEGAGGIGGMLARSHDYMSTNGNWYTHSFYHADGNGNITYLETSAQGLAAYYRYDAYGNELNNVGTLGAANAYRFSSKRIDVNTGLYYYGYRWYAPSLQRWVNRDPIAEVGAFVLLRKTPSGFAPLLLGGIGMHNYSKNENNQFRSLKNNPLVEIDPTGLSCFSDCMQGEAGRIRQNLECCIGNVGDGGLFVGSACFVGCLGSGPGYPACVIACLEAVGIGTAAAALGCVAIAAGDLVGTTAGCALGCWF